jgi:hypothetical protein
MHTKLTMLFAAVVLAGCAIEQPGPAPVPGQLAAARGNYEAYYDGFYGPFVDGYWGDDGGFYYADRDRHWRRDEGGHFRHGMAQGFNHVHGSEGPREH